MTLPLILRIVRVGVVAALAAGLAGWTFERARFGASDEAALRGSRPNCASGSTPPPPRWCRWPRASPRIRKRREPGPRDQAAAAAGCSTPSRRSCRQTTLAAPASSSTTASANRWRGRVACRTFPRNASSDRRRLLIAPGALGPRLIRIEPLVENTASARATVVAEQALALYPGRAGPQRHLRPADLDRAGDAARPRRRIAGGAAGSGQLRHPGARRRLRARSLGGAG